MFAAVPALSRFKGPIACTLGRGYMDSHKTYNINQNCSSVFLLADGTIKTPRTILKNCDCIFQPLSSIVKALTRIFVITAEKTPPDRSTDDVDAGCFSGTDLHITWFWHESTSLLLYIKLLTVNIRIFRARCNHSSSILFWVS